MIELNGLTKSFGSKRGVFDINFSVPEGSIMGFIGHNGAGKSTAFRILCGLMDADSGSASIAGLEVKPRNFKKIKETIGYMPDIFGVYERMTVWEYLDFFGATYRIPVKQRKKRIEAALELARSSHMLDYQVASLSRGMRQRIGLAKTILHDPKVLILDEPAGGLDPQARVEMREMIMSLRDLGKTIILSSHILPELGNVCDLVGIINKGHMEAFGSMHDIVQSLKEKLTYVVSTESDNAVLVGLLREIAEIDEVTEKGGDVIFSFSGARQFSAEVLTYLVGKGMQITSFSEEEADLEEVFMKLAGGKK
jgi:ABC-2 type transport system ATP-binding protein